MSIMTFLYRGGKKTTYQKLRENGFDLDKINSNYGDTLGPGIYLTKIPEEALGYAEDRKTIIKVPVLGLNSYKLDRAFSVTSKKHKRKMRELKQYVIEQGYNSIESVCGFETVIFTEFYDIINWNESEILEYI